MKQIHRDPDKVNSSKINTYEYINVLLNLQAENLPVIYLDETTFNWFTPRIQGLSNKTSYCTFVVADSCKCSFYWMLKQCRSKTIMKTGIL